MQKLTLAINQAESQQKYYIVVVDGEGFVRVSW